MFKYEVIFRNEEIHQINVLFPKVYGKEPVEIKYTNADLTSRLCEINLMKFILLTLKGYIARRERAFQQTGTYTCQRKLAVDRINFRINHCEEGRLGGLVVAVSNLQLSFSQIRPSTQSKHYQNYSQKIEPLIDWCIGVAESHTKSTLKRKNISS